MPTKKSNPLYFYIVFAMLLSGVAWCDGFFDLFDGRDKYYPLEDQYKIKFKQGDILKYTDQFGATFELEITMISIDKRVASRKGSSGPYTTTEYQTVHYDTANVISSPNTWFNIYSQQPMMRSVNWEPGLYGYTGGDTGYFEQVTLNSKVYHSVYKLEGKARAPSLITTWYYSYAYGFVGFERSNGQRFTLKIP